MIIPYRPADIDTTVYRAYGRDGRLLYVGRTLFTRQRMENHKRQSPWFTDVHSWIFTYYVHRQAAADAEVEAIRTEDPLHNILMNPRYRSPGGPARPPYSRAYRVEATP